MRATVLATLGRLVVPFAPAGEGPSWASTGIAGVAERSRGGLLLLQLHVVNRHICAMGRIFVDRTGGLTLDSSDLRR
jgi:hypothetical protein